MPSTNACIWFSFQGENLLLNAFIFLFAQLETNQVVNSFVLLFSDFKSPGEPKYLEAFGTTSSTLSNRISVKFHFYCISLHASRSISVRFLYGLDSKLRLFLHFADLSPEEAEDVSFKQVNLQPCELCNSFIIIKHDLRDSP